MKTAMLCFSQTGLRTGERLLAGLREKGMSVTLEGKSKYLKASIEMSAGEWAGQRFRDSEYLIFIGACGIAVRSIAPYVADKKTDPGVLVIDECGNYVISLLSGHLGGANALAVLAAELLGAAPVLTTATDLHHRFAVDVFAKRNRCAIRNMTAAKEVSAALLAGENVGFYSEFPFDGELPMGFLPVSGEEAEMPEIGIAVTIHEDCKPFASTVQVIPPAAVLGMGCKKGREAEAVLAAAENCLEGLGIAREAVSLLTSIDLKKEEPGFLALSKEWGIPFATYTGEELAGAKGSFTPSAFVKSVTGTDNVCERSAVLGSGQGALIQKKISGNGVTAAVSLKNWRVSFE